MYNIRTILKNATKISLDLHIEKTQNALASRFSFRSLNNDIIYGHFFETKEISKNTWIILYHGLGAHTQTAGYLEFVSWWNNQGYDVIGMDIRQQGGLTKGLPLIDQRGLYLSGLESLNTYYYTCVYVDAYRLVDVALTLKPNHRIYVAGGSQGGALALVASSLHPSIQLAMVEMPSNTDIQTLIHESTGGFRAFSTYEVKIPNWIMDDIDVMSYAKHIKVPVLLSSGTEDSICPHKTAVSLYNALNCTKKLIVYPGYGHGGYDALFFKEKLSFIQEIEKNASSSY